MRQLYRTIATATVLSLACGDDAPSGGDASFSDAASVDATAVDAGGVPDATELPLVPTLWREVVSSASGNPNEVSLTGAFAAEGVVLVVGTPELVLLNADGDELGRRPPPTFSSTIWANAIVQSAPGEVAVYFGDLLDRAAVHYYSLKDLSHLGSTTLPDFDLPSGVLARTSSGLYHVRWIDDTFQVYDLSGAAGTLVATYPTTAVHSIRGVGLSDSNGRLLVCSTHRDEDGKRRASMVRLATDGSGWAVDPVDVAAIAVDNPCWLEQTSDGLHAVWYERRPDGAAQIAVRRLDGEGIPTREPSVGETAFFRNNLAPSSFGLVGVGITFAYDTTVQIGLMDGLLIRNLAFEVAPGEVAWPYGQAPAADGDNVYAVITEGSAGVLKTSVYKLDLGQQ